MDASRFAGGPWRWLPFVPWLLVAASAWGQCTQITGWSAADASFFPAPRVTRTDRSNTPVLAYFYVDSSQERSERVTYFSFTATPSLVRDQLFTNAVSVNLSSFASEAAARTVFSRDAALFRQLNPLRWGYHVVTDEGSVLSYYADVPGAKVIEYLAVHQNTIVHITLRSASQTESMTAVGVPEMARRAEAARALIDGHCGITPGNVKPRIEVYASGDLFDPLADVVQREMAAGNLSIVVSDDNGLADLDWNSFRLSVAGIDKTEHALAVIQRLAVEHRVEVIDSGDGTGQLLRFRLDPRRLMTDHNLFNIVWNGNWRIGLRICDRRGACGTSEVELPFGPYLYLSDFADLRCTGPGSDLRLQVVARWGNNGYDAVTNFYVGLGPANTSWETWTSGYFTLSMGQLPPFEMLQWFNWTFGTKPVLANGSVALDSGTAVAPQSLDLPVRAWTSTTAQSPLPGQAYTLAYGAIDLTQTVLSIRQRQVTLCNAR